MLLTIEGMKATVSQLTYKDGWSFEVGKSSPKAAVKISFECISHLMLLDLLHNISGYTMF